MSGENNADLSTSALLAGRQFINQFQQHSLLTRDSRMKERKHYGLRGARRGTQFSKR